MAIKIKTNPRIPKKTMKAARKAVQAVKYRHLLCSGWGVFPDGVKCTGCSDCRAKKKFLKQKNKSNAKK